MVNRLAHLAVTVSSPPPDAGSHKAAVLQQPLPAPRHATKKKKKKIAGDGGRLPSECRDWTLGEEHLSLGNYPPCTTNIRGDSSII